MINVFKIFSPIVRLCQIASTVQSITKYYRLLESITEYNSVLQSVTECYRVLQSVKEDYRVSQNVTECYRVLQSITKYHKDSDKSSASTWTYFWACLFLKEEIHNYSFVFSVEEKFLFNEDLHTFASVNCYLITLQGKRIVTSCGRKVICIKRLFAPEPVYK